jgi:hypothetical protein
MFRDFAASPVTSKLPGLIAATKYQTRDSDYANPLDTCHPLQGHKITTRHPTLLPNAVKTVRSPAYQGYFSSAPA